MDSDIDGAAVADPAAFALVWIDAKGTRILRWRDGVVETWIDSDIPVHERSTAHVRHDPRTRHGGGGRGADDAARHRTEHIRRYLRRVEAELGPHEDLELIGGGPMCGRLASEVHRSDLRQHRRRTILVNHAMRMSRRQLAARLKSRLGMVATRGGAGSYRWTGALPQTRSGRVRSPRRVVLKASPRERTTPLEVEEALE
jgi:hypothetical protein